MKRVSKKVRTKVALRTPRIKALKPGSYESAFREIAGLIQSARGRALRAVNTELIELYWRVGQYISRKLETAVWEKVW